MNELYAYIIEPFANDHMRRALAACVALSLSGAPLGVFLALRRMSLMGDAMSHGILPGVAIAFLMYGMAPWPMTAGGLLIGLLVVFIAGAITRLTPLKEDASLTGVYMISLAAGVLMLSRHGGDEELVHALFGNIFKIASDALWLMIAAAAFSLILMAAMYRGLIIECADPCFLRTAKGKGALYHQLFLVLVVINLVAAFQAMGTLMGLGLMMLPAISTRLWTRNIDQAIVLAMLFSLLSSLPALLLAFHMQLLPGPAIVFCAGVIYILSIIFGTSGGLITRILPHKHFTG